jgi:hypothetical protein
MASELENHAAFPAPLGANILPPYFKFECWHPISKTAKLAYFGHGNRK